MTGVMLVAEGATNELMSAVGDAIGSVIGWVKSVITALFSGGDLNALLPLFAIGIAISAILLGTLSAEGKECEFGKHLEQKIPSQVHVLC